MQTALQTQERTKAHAKAAERSLKGQIIHRTPRLEPMIIQAKKKPPMAIAGAAVDAAGRGVGAPWS